jgi:hypothetical protein
MGVPLRIEALVYIASYYIIEHLNNYHLFHDTATKYSYLLTVMQDLKWKNS